MMSENEEAMSMLDNIEEHCEAQHHEIARLTRERDEARAECERLRGALERISNPISWELRHVPEGHVVNGQGLIELVSYPAYYQGVAKMALDAARRAG